MKTLRFFPLAALCVAAALTSCQKEEQAGIVTDDGNKSIVLSLNFDADTKAVMTPGDQWNTETPDFTTIDVYFTDANDGIKYAFRGEADGDADAQAIFNNITTANGVRFLGMKGISRVYVVANGSMIDGLTYGQLSEEGKKIGDLNALLLKDFNPAIAQNAVPFIGGDIKLEAAESVSEEGGEVIVDAEATGGRYYLADIVIRPVLSRIEVTGVSIAKEGTVYFEQNESGSLVPTTEANATYSVQYRNFDATLTGVYMSSVYEQAQLLPEVTLNTWGLFETPTFSGSAAPIAQGNWSILATDKADFNNAIRHSNYAGNAYASLVPAEYTHDSFLFDGNVNSQNKVIPFNFFYPYNAVEVGESNAAIVTDGAAAPKLHFQFQPSGTGVEIVAIQQKTDGAWSALDQSNSLYSALEAAVKWPVTPGSENVAYVNVIGFGSTAGREEADVTINPGKIYRMENFTINPALLSVDTETTDATNIIVTVEVVNFIVENVYPVFE
ncbi:MAG TPA: hypothetical protein IAC03_06415 [Candidatus Coprenecus pullistercoris]|nr:hypothetical protein [Candidatus Coprenecus pullistercoris]